MQEASKQLKVLQQELQAFVSEGQVQRQKLEEAEARCVPWSGGWRAGQETWLAIAGCAACIRQRASACETLKQHRPSPRFSTAPPTSTGRCEALEARCLELETGGQALAEQLAAAEEEREQLSAQRAALEEQLGEARLQAAQLEQQQETLASVQQVGQQLGAGLTTGAGHMFWRVSGCMLACLQHVEQHQTHRASQQCSHSTLICACLPCSA